MPAPIVVADSITRVGPDAVGAVVVNGSHGGVYAAYLAAKLRLFRARKAFAEIYGSAEALGVSREWEAER